MQPGTNPEDIHTILSRFSEWAGEEPANGNGHAKKLKGLEPGVREISYEEAMRLLRKRGAIGAASTAAQPAAEPAPAAAQKAAPAEKPAALRKSDPSEPQASAVETPLPLRTAAATAAMGTAAPARKVVSPAKTKRKTGARNAKAAPLETTKASIGTARKKLRPSIVAVKRTAGAGKAAEPKRAIEKQQIAIWKPKAEKRPTTIRKQRRNGGYGQQAERAPEFRQVLARSVHEAKPAARAVQTEEKGREQRVSVRLSRAEEKRLQACAASAGVTVSEYLRMRALEPDAAVPKSRAGGSAVTHDKRKPVQAAPEATRPSRGGLGDWIALLRNRFLASPLRFAERA
jgi:hypothetical protein